MKKKSTKTSSGQLDEKVQWFVNLCRQKGLKVTPQRVAVYRELLETDRHPAAEKLHSKVKQRFPGISLDTVNRTLLTLVEIGAAFVVEGSGEPKRFDAEIDDHVHFKCVKCRKIIDFHNKSFENIKAPREVSKKCKVLRKTVYLEGICDLCIAKGKS